MFNDSINLCAMLYGLTNSVVGSLPSHSVSLSYSKTCLRRILLKVTLARVLMSSLITLELFMILSVRLLLDLMYCLTAIDLKNDSTSIPLIPPFCLSDFIVVLRTRSLPFHIKV